MQGSAPLTNKRHESFCQAMASGLNLKQSYEAVGYAYSGASASKLKKRPDVSNRIQQLLEPKAKSFHLDKDSILSYLATAMELALESGDPRAITSVADTAAKVTGIYQTVSTPTATISVTFADAPQPVTIEGSTIPSVPPVCHGLIADS